MEANESARWLARQTLGAVSARSSKRRAAHSTGAPPFDWHLNQSNPLQCNCSRRRTTRTRVNDSRVRLSSTACLHLVRCSVFCAGDSTCVTHRHRHTHTRYGTLLLCAARYSTLAHYAHPARLRAARLCACCVKLIGLSHATSARSCSQFFVDQRRAAHRRCPPSSTRSSI